MTTTPSTPDPFASVVTAQTIYGSLQELRGELNADRTAQALLRKDVADLKESDRAQNDHIRALEQGQITEERVAAIAKKQTTESQTSLRGWLMVILAFLAILSAAATALFIAVFL